MRKKKEPPTITGELPLSIGVISRVYKLSVSYLWVKGLFYVLLGVTWVFYKSPARSAGIEWLWFLNQDTVGVIWMGSGLIAILSSITSQGHMRRLGFFMLIATPTLLGAYFSISWIIYFIPGISYEGFSRGITTSISYWAYTASAYIAALIYSVVEPAHKAFVPEEVAR